MRFGELDFVPRLGFGLMMGERRKGGRGKAREQGKGEGGNSEGRNEER